MNGGAAEASKSNRGLEHIVQFPGLLPPLFALSWDTTGNICLQAPTPPAEPEPCTMTKRVEALGNN